MNIRGKWTIHRLASREALRLLGGPFEVSRQMNVSALSSKINALSAVKAGSLRFWGDWFGKPYDNYHRIARCSAADASLLIEFDEGELLTIRDPEGVSVSADVFCVKNATLVCWEWFYYGRPHTVGNRYFYEYVRDGSQVTGSTNVDWYKPVLAPSLTENAVEIL